MNPREPKRLVLASLAAGLIFNVGGIAAAALLDLPAIFREFGAEPSAETGMLHLALRFGLGFVTAWLVAGTHRSSTAPGWPAVIGTGLAVWFCAYVPGSFVLSEVGVLPGAALWFSLLWGCGESLLAAVVAARLLHPGSWSGHAQH